MFAAHNTRVAVDVAKLAGKRVVVCRGPSVPVSPPRTAGHLVEPPPLPRDRRRIRGIIPRGPAAPRHAPPSVPPRPPDSDGFLIKEAWPDLLDPYRCCHPLPLPPSVATSWSEDARRGKGGEIDLLYVRCFRRRRRTRPREDPPDTDSSTGTATSEPKEGTGPTERERRRAPRGGVVERSRPRSRRLAIFQPLSRRGSGPD